MRLADFIETLQKLAAHPDIGPDIEVCVPTKWGDDSDRQYSPNIGTDVSAIDLATSWKRGEDQACDAAASAVGEAGNDERLWARDPYLDEEARADLWRQAPRMLVLSEFGGVRFRGAPLDEAQMIPSHYAAERCERCGQGAPTRRLVNRIVTCDACYMKINNAK